MDVVVQPEARAIDIIREPDGLHRAQRRTLVVLGLLLLLLGTWTIRAFLPALGWAAILAIATWPLYRRARERWPARGHDIVLPAIFTAGVALLFLIPLALAAIQIARESHVVFNLVEEARRTGLPVPEGLAKLPWVGAAAASWWSDNLTSSAAASELIERMNHGTFAGLHAVAGRPARPSQRRVRVHHPDAVLPLPRRPVARGRAHHGEPPGRRAARRADRPADDRLDPRKRSTGSSWSGSARA